MFAMKCCQGFGRDGTTAPGPDQGLHARQGATLARYPKAFWELVEQRARRDPHHIVVADEHGRTRTRAQLRDDAERVAAALAARGVVTGSVVSWQLPSTVEAVVLMAALARLGAVQNPLVPVLREREVGFIAAQVGTELMIVPERWRGFEFGDMARGIGARVGFDVVTIGLEQAPETHELRLPMRDADALPRPVADGAPMRWIYASSGTTADPKAARHTDSSIMHSASGLIDGLGLGPTDCYPIAWPCAHIGGGTMLTAALVAGVRLALFESFDPSSSPVEMAEHHPTLLGSALPFFRAYMDAQRRHGPTSLFPEARCAMWGGAPLPAEIHDEMLAELGLVCLGAWGLTECPIATCASLEDDPTAIRLGVGRPSDGVSIRVVGPDD